MKELLKRIARDLRDDLKSKTTTRLTRLERGLELAWETRGASRIMVDVFARWDCPCSHEDCGNHGIVRIPVFARSVEQARFYVEAIPHWKTLTPEEAANLSQEYQAAARARAREQHAGPTIILTGPIFGRGSSNDGGGMVN